MRQSQSVAGGVVIECACQRRDDEPIAELSEITKTSSDGRTVTDTDKERKLWIPQDGCTCNGSGWVCWRCLGRMWVTANGRAVPCESCAMVESGEVKPQAWILKYQQAERSELARRAAEIERFRNVGKVVYADAAA